MAKTENDTKSPFGTRWLISGVVVLLALGLVVFMALRGGRAEESAPARSDSSAATASSAGTAADAAPANTEACKPPKTRDTKAPVEAPEVSWERHPSGGVVPVSAEHGPVKRDGQFWHCTSHTPTGAVIAGMTLVYNFATGDKDSGSASEKRDEMFRRGQYNSTTQLGTIEGYRLVLNTPDEAEVEYLISVSGGYAVMRVPMVWDQARQDWVLNTESNSLGASAIKEPTGFTQWR